MSGAVQTSPAVIARERVQTLFAHTMGLVAATTALFAVGAYLGRNLTYTVGLFALFASFGVLIAMGRVVRVNPPYGVPLLMAFGILIGVAMGPTLAYYANVDPQALWMAGGATALFIAGFGAAGYAARRDLAPLARVAFFGLLGLIIVGIVGIFIRMPVSWVLYSALGLVIFAALTAYDFQRLRKSKNIDDAPLLAASIFLDVLNVFMFFLRIFGGR